ncbi:MAG: purple acid phosphatase family protein [Acidimicrobiales bacterium]
MRGIDRRSFLKGAAATAGALAVGPTLWTKPGFAAVPPAGAHLAFGTDPSTSMTVVWSTPEPVANPRLIVDVGGDLVTWVAETRTVPDSLTQVLIKHVGTNYHRATVTGLAPGTAYDYVLRHDGGELVDGLSFATAPSNASAFTFTAFGDQGIHDASALINQQIAAMRPAFNLVAGDLCYADNLGFGLVIDALQFDPNTWDRWFAQGGAAMATTPFMAALGNHDIEPGYGDHGYVGHHARLPTPDGGFSEHVYSFRYGNIGVVSLDANDISEEIPSNAGYTGGGQTAWLDGTLAALRADPTVDFIVVYFHHCAYCTMDSHGSDGGVRARWVPLFDTHAVDLVINGHNHGYERTHPIRANSPTLDAPTGATVRPADDGTTYICAGGGGQSLNAFVSPAFISHGPLANTLKADAEIEDAPWSAVRDVAFSFLRVDVTPPSEGVTTMAITTLDAQGNQLDAVTLERVRALASSAGAPAGTPAETGAGSGPSLPATGGAQLVVPAAAASTAALGGLALARRLGRAERIDELGP